MILRLTAVDVGVFESSFGSGDTEKVCLIPRLERSDHIRVQIAKHVIKYDRILHSTANLDKIEDSTGVSESSRCCHILGL